MNEVPRKNLPTLWEKSRGGRQISNTTHTNIPTKEKVSREEEERKQYEEVHNRFVEDNAGIVDWVNEIINDEFLNDLKFEFARRIEKSQTRSLALDNLSRGNIVFTHSKYGNFAEVIPGRRYIHLDIGYLKKWFEEKDSNYLKVAYVHEAVHLNSFNKVPMDTKEVQVSGFSMPNLFSKWGSFLNEGQTDWLAISILSNVDPEFNKIEASEYVSYKANVDIFISIIEVISLRTGVGFKEVAYAFDRAYFNGEFFAHEFHDILKEMLGKELWERVLRLHPSKEDSKTLKEIYDSIESLKQHQH